MNYGSLKLGAGKYVAIPTGQASHLVLGTNNFTIEAWVYPTDYSYTAAIVSMDTLSGTTNSWYFGIDNDSGGNLMFGINSTDNFATTGQQVPLNQWSHVAVTKSAGVIDTWVNGVKSTASVTSSTDLSANGELRIGRGRSSSSNYFNGWIAGVRVIIGESLYTTSFTPPNAPLQNTANTALLLSSEYKTGVFDSSIYSKEFTKYSLDGMSTLNPWSTPQDYTDVDIWNTIESDLSLKAIKDLIIPDDPLVDFTIVRVDDGNDTYSI